MLTRREFLRASACVTSAATVTLLLTPLGCSSSDESDLETSTGTTLPGCDGTPSTSSVVSGHTHMLCVASSDLATPPAGGVTYTTTPWTGDGHAHDVTLTQAQLVALASAQTVAASTSAVAGHIHTFAIVQQVTVPPTAGGGSGGFY